MLQPRTGPCWAPARDRFLYIRAFGPLLSPFFFSFRFLLYRLPIDRASPSLLSVPVPILPEPSHYLKLVYTLLPRKELKYIHRNHDQNSEHKRNPEPERPGTRSYSQTPENRSEAWGINLILKRTPTHRPTSPLQPKNHHPRPAISQRTRNQNPNPNPNEQASWAHPEAPPPTRQLQGYYGPAALIS